MLHGTRAELLSMLIRTHQIITRVHYRRSKYEPPNLKVTRKVKCAEG